MKWSHKWRDQIANGFYYKLLEKGSISYLDLEPELGGLSWYFEAFVELGSCRSIGMAMGPIPFTAILKYSSIYDIVGDEFEEFFYLMRTLDNEYLNLEYKKTAVKSDQSRGKKNSSN